MNWSVGAISLSLMLIVVPLAPAQDRDAKVRQDRQTFSGSTDWIYNDLTGGLEAARTSARPLMVVFRCIPCEACQKFDDDVARRDPVIRDLLDQFVCVRIIQANAIDLTRFQYDFDLSFAVIFMDVDQVIYGRYGTRSERPEGEDISLAGLRHAMEGALDLHRRGRAIRPALEGKQAKPFRFRTPLDFPSLAGRYRAGLDYEDKVAQSCVHCHQIREAERLVYRSEGKPIPDFLLYPYPDPAVLGLKMDPRTKATIERVTSGSEADRAGLRPGDEIATLEGQPLVSTADLQWVLHNAPDDGSLRATLDRAGKKQEHTLSLKPGWRRGNISWRATTWDLRRMGLGGLLLEPLSTAERAEAQLAKDSLALRVRWAGEHGQHGAAKRAGVERGDIVVGFDELTGPLSEADLLAYAVQRKRPGDAVTLTLKRKGQTRRATFALQ
jgi:hypothetical protein